MVFCLTSATAQITDPCIVEDTAGNGTVSLPPEGCEYLSPEEVHLIIEGLPDGTTIELAPIHKDFICQKVDPASGLCGFPGGSLQGEVEIFESTIVFQAKGTGRLAGFEREIKIPLLCEVHTGPRNPGDSVQTFPNDMYRLEGQLPAGDPHFASLNISGGTNFQLPSPGETTLTDLGGGLYHVDSFFDVSYEIEFRGAPDGPLANMAGTTQGRLKMVAQGGGGGGTCNLTDPVRQTASSSADLLFEPLLPDLQRENLHLTGEVETEVRPSTVSGVVQTEIVSMSLSGESSMGPVRLTLSRGTLFPTPSLGSARCDGDFLVDSFFDVAFEIEVETAPGEVTRLHNDPDEPLRVRAPRVPIVHDRSFEFVQDDNFNSAVRVIDDNGNEYGRIRNVVHRIIPPPPPPPCPHYPPAGIDVMYSNVFHDIDIPGIGLCSANLRGPVEVQRSGPYVDPLTGRCCIDTEIIRMELSGNDPACGDINIKLDPCRPSKGRICEEVPGSGFPATSWFDVYIVVELKDQPGTCLYACRPARMQCRIQRIPPIRCLYNLNVGEGGVIPLYKGPCMDDCDPAVYPCNQVPLPPPDAYIVKAVHEPLPPEQCNCFPEAGEDVLYTKLGHKIDLPGIGMVCEVFDGPITVRYSDAYLNSDGLCCLDTEIINMEMTGLCGLPGDVPTIPAKIRLSPDRPSKGHVCQQQPGACFPAYSVFNVFFEIEVQLATGIVKFRNCKPAIMECKITALPPLGCNYQLRNAPILLYQVVPGAVSPCLKKPLPGADGKLENANHLAEEEAEPCCDEYGPGIDVFHSNLRHNVRIPGIGYCQSNLSGPVKIVRGPSYRNAAGFCCVDVEIEEMRLTGVDPTCGDLEIVLDPRRPSMGLICEKNPGTCFQAKSCFDVFVIIKVKDHDLVLVPCEPARMCCQIERIPPYKCLYNLDIGEGDVVPLYEDRSILLPDAGAAGGGAGVPLACVEPDAGGTVELPPASCGYVSPEEVHMIIDGLPAGTTIEIGVEHMKFFDVTRTPGGDLGGEIETFQSHLVMDMKGTGTLAGFLKTTGVQVKCEVHTGPRNPGDPVQTFDTEMVRLEGELLGDPDFAELRVIAGTAFTMPSPGQTTLTKLPGGNFNVDSFFDIAYQIEFTGTAGGSLGGLSGSTQGTIRMATGVSATKPRDPCEEDPRPAPRAFLEKVGPDGTVETVHEPIDPRLPPAGTDVLESEATVQVELPGFGPGGDSLIVNGSLSGKFTCERGDPVPDPTKLGRLKIPAKITQMDLLSHPVNLPAVQPNPKPVRMRITLHPDMLSTGEILADAEPSVDPATGESSANYLGGFFDVFVEVDLPGLGGLPVPMKTRAPVRMEIVKPAEFKIPPYNDRLRLRLSAVPLFLNDQAIGEIKEATHIPREPCDLCPEYGPGIDVMDSKLIHDIEIPGVPLCTAPLQGKITVARGKPYVNAAGVCCVTTDILKLNLTGEDEACGPIEISLNPARLSQGWICQQPEFFPECFLATSCFDVYIEVRMPELDLVLVNCKPVRMCCKISGIPPYRCVYVTQWDPGVTGLELFKKSDCENPDAQPVGRIVRAEHEPRPCDPLTLKCRAVISPDGEQRSVLVTWSTDPDCEDCERIVVRRKVTYEDGTVREDTFTFAGGQNQFDDDLANVPCPDGEKLVIEYCVSCVIRGVESDPVCCTVTVPCPQPCEITSVSCQTANNRTVITWTTNRPGCCDRFLITRDGQRIATVPGTDPMTHVVAPCEPGLYCVQCVLPDGTVVPSDTELDPAIHCCRVTLEDCCEGVDTTIQGLQCVVGAAAKTVALSWTVTNPECCRGFRVTLPDGTTQDVDGTSVTLPCQEGRYCVQCLRADGGLGPQECCDVVCPCEIESVQCTRLATAAGYQLTWTVSRDDCCEEFKILLNGVEIDRVGQNVRSYTIDPCEPGVYCVQCVRPDGTELPIDSSRHCCEITEADCCEVEDAKIVNVQCQADAANDAVTLSWDVEHPECCDEIVIVKPDGTRVPVPAAETSITLTPCQPGEYCVQCVRTVDGAVTVVSEECCDIPQDACRPPCEFIDISCQVTTAGIVVKWVYDDPRCLCAQLQIRDRDGNVVLADVPPGSVQTRVPGWCKEIFPDGEGTICVVCLDAAGNVLDEICCDVECPGLQKPGDCNSDGALDISDAVCLLGVLFLGTPPTLPCGEGANDPANVALMDVNGSGANDIADAVYILNFLFNGGPPPRQGRDCILIPGCPNACDELPTPPEDTPKGDDLFDSAMQFNVLDDDGAVVAPKRVFWGPVEVRKGEPYLNEDGHWVVPTEMVSLSLNDLAGRGETIRLSAMTPSRGEIISQQGPDGPFFPCDSFFDVFVEIDLPGLFATPGILVRVEAKDQDSVPGCNCYRTPEQFHAENPGAGPNVSGGHLPCPPECPQEKCRKDPNADPCP